MPELLLRTDLFHSNIIPSFLYTKQFEYYKNAVDEYSPEELSTAKMELDYSCDFLIEENKINFDLSELIIGIHFNSYELFSEQIPRHLCTLFNGDSFSFFMERRAKWKLQQNEETLAAQAFTGFEETFFNINENNIINSSKEEFKNILLYSFWINRCAVYLPPVYFSDTDDNFIGYICKHGNVHFYASELQLDLLRNKAISKGFDILELTDEKDCF